MKLQPHHPARQYLRPKPRFLKSSVVFSDTIFYENILNIEPVLLKLIMILTNIPSILRHPRISGSETPVRILDTPSAPQYFAFRSKIY